MLKTREDSTNYACNVIKLPVMQKIEGMDNLVKVEVFGNECLIGKDSDPDAVYLFFPAGCAIDNQFLSLNNLFRDATLNKDPDKKGFFEPNGRVKGLKLRGVVSTGFVIPYSSLNEMFPNGLAIAIGEEFTTIDDFDLCKKYYAPGNTPGQPKDKQAKVNNKLADLLIPTQFRFHKETEHLAKHLDKLDPESIIVITDKWHGSSCILSKVLINKKLNKLQKLWNKWLKFLPPFPTKQMGYIYSSGKPKSSLPKGIEGVWENKGVDYYNTNIWAAAAEKYKYAVEEGITLYGELVGYTADGSTIQKGYDYKCSIGENRFVIYRITHTRRTGEIIELSWQQIKDYCDKYALECVKEFYFGKTKDLLPNSLGGQEITGWSDLLFETLQRSFNLEKKCKECNNDVSAEGIVLRVDGKLSSYSVYKLKSKLFVLGETNEEEVNIEDNQ